MVKRYFSDGNRITVSRPGYDAENPIAVRSEYLSLDSRLNIERPLRIGFVPNVSVNTIGFVSFGTTFPYPPGVDVFWHVINSYDQDHTLSKQTIFRDTGDSPTIAMRTPFAVEVSTNGFTLTPTVGITSADNAVIRNLTYFAWRLR